MASTIIAVITDTHIGGTTALAPPKFTEHTGYKNETRTATYNEYQKWLHACWLDFWDYTKHRAGIRGKYRRDRLIVFHLGDIADGNHHGTNQIVFEPNDQEKMAVALLDPVVKFADRMYVTYGSDPHNGGAGAMEINICNELGNTVKHDWYHSLDIDGVRFDIGHHGRAGKRDWTSSAAGYAVEIALEYVKSGMAIPHYVLRGHNHVIDDGGSKLDYIRAIACPSWQLRTAFGNKVKGGRARSDIGGLVFDTGQRDYVDFNRARYAAPSEERQYEVV